MCNVACIMPGHQHEQLLSSVATLSVRADLQTRRCHQVIPLLTFAFNKVSQFFSFQNGNPESRTENKLLPAHWPNQHHSCDI